jgi:heme o synthase
VSARETLPLGCSDPELSSSRSILTASRRTLEDLEVNGAQDRLMTREPFAAFSLGSSSTGCAARDLAALTKPRITFIVLATCGTGMAIAPVRIAPSVATLALLGTALIVASANVLNMWWERDTDALMLRTRRRPLPAGRMTPDVALFFGLALGALSIPMLIAVNALTAVLGVLALVTYVLLYTPLKRRTWLALWVGAVAGAMPPLMGWTSVTGSLYAVRGEHAAGLSGIMLSLLLFTWQLPHFNAIALFRAEDYARARLKVVSVELGKQAAKRHIAAYAALLVGVSYGLARVRGAGFAVAVAVLVLGALFLVLAGWGLRTRAGSCWAKAVFAYSIVYLSLLLAILVVDRVGV